MSITSHGGSSNIKEVVMDPVDTFEALVLEINNKYERNSIKSKTKGVKRRGSLSNTPLIDAAASDDLKSFEEEHVNIRNNLLSNVNDENANNERYNNYNTNDTSDDLNINESINHDVSSLILKTIDNEHSSDDDGDSDLDYMKPDEECLRDELLMKLQSQRRRFLKMYREMGVLKRVLLTVKQRFPDYVSQAVSEQTDKDDTHLSLNPSSSTAPTFTAHPRRLSSLEDHRAQDIDSMVLDADLHNSVAAARVYKRLSYKLREVKHERQELQQRLLTAEQNEQLAHQHMNDMRDAIKKAGLIMSLPIHLRPVSNSYNHINLSFSLMNCQTKDALYPSINTQRDINIPPNPNGLIKNLDIIEDSMMLKSMEPVVSLTGAHTSGHRQTVYSPNPWNHPSSTLTRKSESVPDHLDLTGGLAQLQEGREAEARQRYAAMYC